MTDALLAAYRLTAWVAHRLPYPPGTLGASIAGRRNAGERWARWAAAGRSRAPLVWIHGASVGELLTATPVADRLRSARPGLRVMYTHSSPSAAGWHIDPLAPLDYVPLDEPAPLRLTLAALQPALLVFSRGDVWPELVRQATAAAIPTAVMAATMRQRTLRSRWPVRALYRPIYRRLSWIGAVDAEQAARWRRAGAPPDVVHVIGDPRHDQVIERVPAFQPIQPLVTWAGNRRILVAGSTHEADERVIIPAAQRILPEHDDAALLLAPHDPTPHRVRAVQRACRRSGVAASVWHPGDAAPETPCVVMAAAGILFDLYALGAFAYVGGGFRTGRVHAVIEPAAWGLPVVAGPAGHTDRDVRLLLGAGGAVTLRRDDPIAALARLWARWIEEPQTLQRAGLAARHALEHGAATRTAQALLALLTDRR